MTDQIDKDALDPDAKKKAARAALNAIGSAIPILGGLISAGAGYWSESDAEHVTSVLKQWLQMLEDELREKGKTIAEVVARLDMQDESVRERIESPRVSSSLEKGFP